MANNKIQEITDKLKRSERFGDMAPLNQKVLNQQYNDLLREQELKQLLIAKYTKNNDPKQNFDDIQNSIIQNPNSERTEINSINVLSKIIAFMSQITAGVVEVTPKVARLFIYLLHFLMNLIVSLMSTTLGQIIFTMLIIMMYNTPIGKWFIDTILYESLKALGLPIDAAIVNINITITQIRDFLSTMKTIGDNISSITPAINEAAAAATAATAAAATTAATTAASTAAFSAMSQAAAQAAAAASANQLETIQNLIINMSADQLGNMNQLLLQNQAFVDALPELTTGVADGMNIQDLLIRFATNVATQPAALGWILKTITETGQLLITGGRKKNRTRRFGKHKSARKTKRRLSRVKRHTKRRGTSKKYRSRK